MPRLLLAATIPNFLEAFLLPYARHFRAKGWRVDGMASNIRSSPACCAAFDEVWPVSWARNPRDASNLLRAPREVRRIVRANSYDIVHVHTPVAGFVCRYAIRGMETATIYTAHGFHFHEYGSPLKNAVYHALEKIAGRWTDYLVVINHADEAAASAGKFVGAENLVYMPGIGLDTRNTYNPDRVNDSDVCSTRKALNLPADARIVLMIAEFIPRKRHQDALQAFVHLNRPDVHLVLVGSGRLLETTRAAVHHLHLEDRVHFLGNRRDIPLLIRTAQAVLLCSEQEGLPRCVMEALALGVPVIGSNIRGTRELLGDGAGFLYPLGDTTALRDLIHWVLDHPAEASVAARTGRQRMMDRDLQNTIALHEALYDKALRRVKIDGALSQSTAATRL